MIEILEKIKSGEITALENVQNKLEIIKRRDPEIRAFIDVFEKDAIVRAKEVDQKIRAGKAGVLAGAVIAVKNNIAIAGARLTCSSKMLENYVAPYSATVIEKILAQDAIIVGTTNMDEFAAGSDTTHSALFLTRNPLDPSRVPGGSSGGAAAAVAAGMADGALATDTGGSIRCPATFCGLVGFKPSYGAVSRFGLVDMAMSLDVIGTIARSVEGAALLFGVIRGKDARDATSIDVTEEVKKEKIKIGVPEEFFSELDPKVSNAVNSFIKKVGANYELVELSIPISKYAVPIYYLLNFAEFSSALQRYDGLRYGAASDRTKELYSSYEDVRGKTFGREVKRRIFLGTYITMKEYYDTWYSQTLAARELLRAQFAKALEQCDALLGPAMPCLPWQFGERLDPIEMYSADILTVSANLIGIPAISFPIAKVNGLPIAAQLQGRFGEDLFILDVAKQMSKLAAPNSNF